MGGRVLAGEFEGYAEAREGGAEFVGDVAEEEFLRGDEGFEAFGHVVEVVDEALEFVGGGLGGGRGGLLDAGA